MTQIVATQQQTTKEEVEEEAEEEEEGRIQCPEEGLKEEEVSTEYSLLHTSRLGHWMGSTELSFRLLFL